MLQRTVKDMELDFVPSVKPPWLILTRSAQRKNVQLHTPFAVQQPDCTFSGLFCQDILRV